MKKHLKPYCAFIALLVLFSSCHPDGAHEINDIAATGSISLSPYEVYPYNVSGVWGALYAIKDIENNSYSILKRNEGAEAVFLNANGTGYSIVQGITLNNAAGLSSDFKNVYRFNIDSAGYYYYSDSVGLDTAVNWVIYGGSNVQDFSYRDIDPFPAYNFVLPPNNPTISGTQPLVINLDASQFSGADSVYIIFPYHSKTPGKVYSVNAGTITVTSAELQGGFPYTYNSYLTIMPFSKKTVSMAGKKYLFVKAMKFVQYVNVM